MLTGTTLRSSTTVAVPTLPLITQAFDVNIDWTASVTGRLGYAWDRWMLYGKGGAAVMHETYALRAPGLITPDLPYLNAKVARLGWTVGVGIENAFLDNWSWKAEYNYMRFDGNDSITNTFLRINKYGGHVPYRCKPSPRQSGHKLQVRRPRSRCRCSDIAGLQSSDRERV